MSREWVLIEAFLHASEDGVRAPLALNRVSKGVNNRTQRRYSRLHRSLIKAIQRDELKRVWESDSLSLGIEF
jgi:hypothetical protein